MTTSQAMLDRLRTAFNEVDPAGLLRHGFPDDEYDPEVRDLEARLSSGIELTPSLVGDVLVQWFGRVTEEDAQRIFELVTNGKPAPKLPLGRQPTRGGSLYPVQATPAGLPLWFGRLVASSGNCGPHSPMSRD